MKITQEFQVAGAPANVFGFFQDVASVAQCMPGAELTDDHGDGSYTGSVSVRLGPMTARFEGRATITSDLETMTGNIVGKGVDRRGGSRGNVTVDYALAASDGGTTVAVDADITISGTAAQFGRTGLLNQITQRLIQQFVDCLEAKLGAEDPEDAAAIEAGEVKGVSLVASTVGSSVAKGAKKLLGRD